MKLYIPLLGSLVFYFKIFFHFVRYKLVVLFFIIAFSGVTEGLGISIAIPLIGYASRGEADNAYSRYIFHILDSIGLGVSIGSILLLLVALFLLKACALIVQSLLFNHISTELLRKFRSEFCYRYSLVAYPYFTQKTAGFFNNIISTEIGTAISGLNNYVRVFVTLTFIAVYVTSACLINFRLTLVVIVLSCLLFFLLRNLARYNQKMSNLITKTNAVIQTLIIQKLNYFKYLKATNSFTPLLRQINAVIRENSLYQFRNLICTEIPQYSMEFCTVVAISGLVWYFVGLNHRPLAEVLVLLVFFHRALLRVLEFQSVWQRFCSYVGGILVVKNVSEDLDAHQERSGKAPVQRLEKGIELTSVDFAYGDRQALSGVSLWIPKNRSVGIVGASGAGKTTVFDLLTGLLQPQGGSISVDGMDYRDVDLASLRSLVGYVTQEPVIFDDTIANNISMWSCADGTDQERLGQVVRAAELANCSDFIREIPEGYQARLGEKGVNLSGGQRQRIAIARELYKDPQLLIFDEATSSLDSESEEYIRQSIEAMKGKRTVVIIAHRISTIRHCDTIFVLNKGVLVEQGTFEQLFSDKRSFFYSLCRNQEF